jgi:hypothetical protein
LRGYGENRRRRLMYFLNWIEVT